MRHHNAIVKRVAAAAGAALMLISGLPAIAGADAEEPPTVSGVWLYVAENGNDAAAGTAAAPFATLEKAVAVARTGDPANTTVLVREGRYFLERPLALTGADSGLTIRADGQVVLSGARDLGNLVWSDHDARIKVASVGTGLGIDQLFINGTNQVLARYPNYEEGKLPLGGAASRAQIKARAAAYADPAGGYLRAIHSAGWGGNDYLITGKDAGNATGLKLQWVGDNNRGSGMNDNVVVENVFEELDAPGEWFYDNAAGKLYLYPPKDTDLSACQIEGAVTTQLITVTGTDSAHPARDITIEGFTFFGTKRTLFTVNEPGMRYIPLMRGDWCVVPAGAVRIENAEGVAVTDSVFRQMGGNGVFFYGYNDGHRIANCDFLDLGATAVQVVGKPDAVYDPSFWPHDLYPGHQVHKTTVTQPDKVGPKTEDYPRDIVIENNHMENMGIFEKQSCGVNMSVSSRIKVLHNTIHKSARSGINVNDGTFGGHEIAYNDVYDCQRETQDHGQFNSWGRDRFWSVPSYNASGQNGDKLRHYVVNGVEYDVTRIDAYQTTSIHNNRFHHDVSKGSTWGIDLDDGSSGYEIYNNLCLGMGIKLREGFDRKVYNNIILDGQFQIHVSYTEANDEIYGNLVLNSTPFGFAAVDENRFKAAGYAVDRNWYYNFDRGVNLPGWFAANRVGSPYDANAMIGVDPDFFNPYGNDYTVGNTAAMAQVGFENFPMDDFGKRNCACHAPVYAKVSASSGSSDVLQREVWKGATISGIDDAIISSTASSGYNGVYFEDVPADSEAYALGLRTRDIVKAVNGVTLGYKGTFHHQFEIIPPNGLVILDIHRANAMQTVSFVKIQGETSTVLWNDPSVRYNGGGANWGTNVNASDHTSLGVHYSTESQPWVEVDFTGSQIAFLSRKYSDQGDCRVTVTDRATGATVVEQTASCYDTQRQYGVAAYTSPVLPQGDYTLRVQKTSGQYLILDCFIVTAFDDSPDHNLLAGPTALTWDSGAPATALRPGETLHIAAPLRNAGEKDLEITAVMGLWDVAGGNQPQTLNTASLILPAGQETVFEESVTLPDDAAGKAVRVLYLADGRPVAYPTTLTGGDFEMPAATPVENAPAGKLEAAFDPATRRITLTAAGLAANAQAVLTAADGDTLLLADQVKATDGAAAFAVGAPASWSGRTITFTVTDEFGAAVSADVSLPEPSFLPGDVDGDGDVDAADALLALQAATGKIRLDEQRQKAADVDAKDGVSASDALLILQKSTGKIGAFPCEK